jgi:hypothetical protein
MNIADKDPPSMPVGKPSLRAPTWVRKAFEESSAPKQILDTLLASDELAPLWSKLSKAQRTNISTLPEFMGFTLPGGKRLPWSEQWTVAEQRQQAKQVAKLARELNKALSQFYPLDPFGLHQVFPHDDNEKHFFLGGLPPVASRQVGGDSLLNRIADMADKFRPSLEKRVKRPTRPDAWEIYFVRTFAPLFNDSVGHAFLAGLVNAFSHGDWDSDRVRKSLTRSRVSKSS